MNAIQLQFPDFVGSALRTILSAAMELVRSADAKRIAGVAIRRVNVLGHQMRRSCDRRMVGAYTHPTRIGGNL
jgi:hypothetical protein